MSQDHQYLNSQPLGQLSFGEDVAEHDDELGSYFLRTSAYWAVARDQTDVVLGAKGTGKSAIARYLTSRGSDRSELDDVLIVPAFNLRGSVLFQRLADQFTDAEDEQTYREIFLAYMVSLVGNHLIQRCSDQYDTSDLSDSLRTSGLKVEQTSAQGIWKKVLSRFRPKFEFGISDSGTPTFSGGADFAEVAGSNNANLSPILLESLEAQIALIYDLLESLGKKCWIVFDRLDEAFADARKNETPALRGLLRAHLDICSHGRRLRPKLFLRLDLFDRITQTEGFVNASHLRVSRIAWDTDSILHLVALRLVFTETGKGNASRALNSNKEIRRICRSILPHRMDGQDPLVWILLITVDATREYNPRNVLTLLRSSQFEQIQIAMRDKSVNSTAEAVLSAKALSLGYRQLSAARLQDLIYSENAEARFFVDKLRGKKTRFTKDEIARKLELDGDSLNEALRLLHYIGFLRLDEDTYVIPGLYRPAMYVSVHGADYNLGADVSQIDLALGDSAAFQAGDNNDIPTVLESPDELTSQKPIRKRSRRSGRTGRDEFVPTGQASEIADELDHASELQASLEVNLIDGRTADPPNTDDFSSWEVLTVTGGKAPTPEVLELLQRARELGSSGQAVEGFWLLHPEYTADNRAASAAADLALLSGDGLLIGQALQMLEGARRRPNGHILAAVLVLRMIQGDPVDQISAVARRISPAFLQDASLTISRMAGLLREGELSFWCKSVRDLCSPTSESGTLQSRWTLIAASRLLPIMRLSWDVLGKRITVRDLKSQIWTTPYWNENSRHIEGYLRAFGRDRASVSLQLRPYQVLSLAAVLDSARRLQPSLRTSVTHQLGQMLDETTQEHRDKFYEWGAYYELARDVTPSPSKSGIWQSEVQPSLQSAYEDSRMSVLLASVVRLLSEHGGPRELCSLSALANHIASAVPGFTCKDYGHSSLRSLLVALSADSGAFRVMRSPTGPVYVVKTSG